VRVGERVVDVLASAPSHNDVLGAQNAQPLRDCGETLLAGIRQFGHASFALRKRRYDPQPRFFSQGAEEARGAFESFVADQASATAHEMVVIAATGSFHENT
jgi:hypothetical protein